MLAQALVLMAAAAVEYNRDIRPILSDKCFACHGPDSGNRQAGLRLDLESTAKAELRRKFPVVAGDPDRSEVIRRIESDNKALRMPPAYAGHEKLTAADGAMLRRWIEEGARWQKHWSLIEPRRPQPPAVKDASRVRNPVDAFLFARLDREGLKPSPEASRATLIRRLSLDLTGLPPTPAEVDEFVQDRADDAYEKVVDRLLASPRYAERMAIRWLEAARYADTNGYQTDGVRDMWRWRDWVIEAFDRNMPFDRFTMEQLAGDLLPKPALSQKIATGFHRNHRTTAEGGIIDEEFRVEYVADRVETTAAVWLGLTLNCARCHDHKYDPLPQKDFYRFFSFFNNVPEKGFVYNFGNEPPFVKAPTAEQQKKWDDLDARYQAARNEWSASAPARQLQQREWERSLTAKPDQDWAPREGLIVDRKLEDVRFDGKRAIDLGTDVAKFNHRDPLTLAVWVKHDGKNGAILTRAEDYWEGSGYGLYLVDGKLRFHFTMRWTDLGMRVETAQPLAPGQWHHVAVTYDGGMKAAGTHLYIDGREAAMKVLFDQHLWPVDHKAPLRIGAGSGLGFEGEIDNVRIYKRALTPDEIAALPLKQSLTGIANLAERTQAQQAKLDLAFVDTFAPDAAMRKAKAGLDAYVATLPTVMVMQEGPVRDAFILKRGAYDAPGEKVTAGTPGELSPFKPEWPVNRLGLAKWLVDRTHPLTARVTVNRYWQMLFGTGIVKTVEDFGSQGEWPMHPELLDWLAVEFMENGWNVKGILKTMVMSSAYRQASKPTAELMQRDPENRLLARGPRLRLSHEMVRDQALAASGLLVERQGGPSVKPYQPPGLWNELAGGKDYQADKGEGLYRRTLYTYWRRTIAPPSMVNFDSPTRETCFVREGRTNTPLQALNLMNDVTYLEAARKMAERMLREGGDSQAARLRYGFRLLLAREPSAGEASILARTTDEFRQTYAADRAAAVKYLAQGDAPRDETLDAAELAAYAGAASLILNLDEAITKE